VSIGKGHLAEAKATVNKELAGAKSAYARGGNDLPHDHDHDHAPASGGGCSSGDTTQRDELLAKIGAVGSSASKSE